MLKLQDFSRQQGVSDRQVQRLLKKYEKELEGLFERKGPNGTWLSDEACEFLRGKMKQQPLAVFEEDPRVERLNERVRMLEARLDDKEKMLTLAQQQVSEAQKQVAALQESVGTIAMLEATSKAAEGRAAQAEERAREAELKAESTEKQIDLVVKRKIEVELALEEAKERAQTAEDIAEAEAQEAARAKAEAEALRAQLDEIAGAGHWKRRKLVKKLSKERKATLKEKRSWSKKNCNTEGIEVLSSIR